jgi:hypothetical protein
MGKAAQYGPFKKYNDLTDEEKVFLEKHKGIGYDNFEDIGEVMDCITFLEKGVDMACHWKDMSSDSLRALFISNGDGVYIDTFGDRGHAKEVGIFRMDQTEKGKRVNWSKLLKLEAIMEVLDG